MPETTNQMRHDECRREQHDGDYKVKEFEESTAVPNQIAHR